jgi:hypothetical protein
MIELINEISENQADLIKSFAIFYLLLVGNYIANSIFTCYQIKFIKIHKTLQIFIAFLLFYFLVTLVSDTGKKEFIPPIEKLLYSFLYFTGFMLLMRLDMFISTIVLILIFMLYFIELNKDYYLEGDKNITNEKDRQLYNSNKYWITINWPFKLKLFPVENDHFKIINKIENIVYYSIIGLLVVGFISYGGEVKNTLNYKKNLTWVDVIYDSQICKIKNKKPFWDYFKIGLGLPL